MESNTAVEKAPEKSFEALVKYCEDIQLVFFMQATFLFSLQLLYAQQVSLERPLFPLVEL